jgi:hypothetical protein
MVGTLPPLPVVKEYVSGPVAAVIGELACPQLLVETKYSKAKSP